MIGIKSKPKSFGYSKKIVSKYFCKYIPLVLQFLLVLSKYNLFLSNLYFT